MKLLETTQPRLTPKALTPQSGAGGWFAVRLEPMARVVVAVGESGEAREGAVGPGADWLTSLPVSREIGCSQLGEYRGGDNFVRSCRLGGHKSGSNFFRVGLVTGKRTTNSAGTTGAGQL